MNVYADLSSKKAPANCFSYRFLILFVAILGFVSYGSLIEAQIPTVVLNDQSVLQPTTKRVGLNIGTIDYWDNGQLLKNLIGTINPGFEPLIDQQIWALPVAGTTTTFTDPDKWDGDPANYWAGGTFKVVASQTGGAELGCTGTIASNTGPNYPTGTETNPVITISTPCAAPFAAGDVIVMTQSFASTPESWWENDRGGIWGSVSGGGKLTSDTTDLCATCGSQSLTLDATASGSTAGIASYFDSASSFDLFVLMNGTYQISFWAKTASGSPSLKVAAERLSAGGFDCGTKTQALTAVWSQYTISCTASETAKTTTPGTAEVTFSVTGGAVYLDNLSFQKVNTDPANTTVFRDEVFNAFKNYYNVQSGGNPGMLRDWLGQNGETYANWTAPDYAHKPTATGGSFMVGPAGSGGQVQLSLEDYLNLCKALNAEPYFEVPVTITEQDAASLVDFLAGPAGSAGGNRRIALGQSEPWTSVFDQIHMSFCNECWNGGSFAGQSLPDRAGAPGGEYYYDYSVRAAAVFKAMRSDPYYTQSAFDLVMNAQTPVKYTMDAAATRAHPDSIEVEDYTYENVNSFATDAALWQPDFVELYTKVTDPTDPSNLYQSVNDYQNLAACGASGSANCGVNIYEWGSGTLEGAIDQSHLDAITAGAGTGIVAALQPLLNMQYFGITADSYFSLAEYQNLAINGLHAKLWGIAVDMGGATNSMRPQYLGLSLINQSIIGPMYSCPISNNVTYNFAGSATNGSTVPPGVPAVNAVPYLYSFCFENGDNRSMVLINTDLSASHTVSFAGTNIPSGTVTQRQYAPNSPDLLNESPSNVNSNTSTPQVALTSATLNTPQSITLPPLSVTALDFAAGSSNPATATPVFGLSSGPYASAQTVSISDATSGATIYYTTDGSTPTTSSTQYTAPLIVSTTETINAMAAATSYSNSSVASATYTIGQATATPVLSVGSGTYSTAQVVSISDATPGAVIYYTLDGTTPTTSSTTYSGPLNIGGSVTLKAIAVAPSYTGSAVASATYTISISASAPRFSPAGGTYKTAQSVSIHTLTAGASIYYTTDGSVPTTASSKYSAAIEVTKSQVLKAIVAISTTSSVKAAASTVVTSPVATAAYTISASAATPTFSLKPGTYAGAQTVTIADTTAGATIYYTTNGATPTTASSKYTGAIRITKTETVKAIAVATSYLNSAIASATYTIEPTVDTPIFSLKSGTYESVQVVTITDKTAGAAIFYSINGTIPVKYTSAIKVAETEKLQAVAILKNYKDSAVAEATYTINRQTDTPTFSLKSGAYNGTQTIKVEDATAGATIYYTTNNTIPTTSSTRYSEAIKVADTETVRAIAVLKDHKNSGVASATYTIEHIADTPTFSLKAGTYTGSQTLTMTDGTAGAAIYYTTNDTLPTTSSHKYTAAIKLTATQTIRAIAVLKNYKNSALASATFKIEQLADTPVISLKSGTYNGAQTVTIKDLTPGAVIYYTTNKTKPTTSSEKYTGPIKVTASETIYAIAIAKNYKESGVAGAEFILTYIAATPKISLGTGSYDGKQTVRITDATAGATIYYTTNGTKPTTSSTRYVGPITVTESEKMQAIATAKGYTESEVAAATYKIVTVAATPTFSRAGGTFTSSVSITIKDATEGAVIYYTTNGSTPTTKSTRYTGAFSVSKTETIHAIAVKAGLTNSEVAKVTYTLEVDKATTNTASGD